MQLLDAENVKKEKDEAEAKKRERIGKLHQEEAKSTKDLNSKREELKVETARINLELEERRDFADQERSRLSAEVNSLEQRKKDALKPIHDLQKEAERKLAVIAKRELDIAEEKKSIEEERSALSLKDSNLIEIEKHVKKIASEFADREKRITQREHHVEIYMEVKERQVRDQLDRARKILEEAKILQIKNKTK